MPPTPPRARWFDPLFASTRRVIGLVLIILLAGVAASVVRAVGSREEPAPAADSAGHVDLLPR